MQKKWFVLLVLLSLLALIAPISFQARVSATEGEPRLLGTPALTDKLEGILTNQIIIQFVDEGENGRIAAEARAPQLSQAAGVTLTYFRPMSGDAHVWQLPEAMPVAELERISADLTALDEVVYAEPDRIKQIVGERLRIPADLSVIPNDPSYADQWHYAGPYGVKLPNAWDVTTGSASTVVAVIDTGILNHNDLAGRTVAGYDFISDPFVGNDGNGRDNNPADPGDWITANECGFPHSADSSSWHGTHVAGTIGAATNNGLGVAGVNWNAKILPVRVLGKCGGLTSDIVDGMRWAAGLAVTGVPNNANPAKVINMSLGGSGACSTTEQNAINAITNAGTTVVIAAGNENQNASNSSPGNCNNVITVAATNRNGNRAFYSNFGSVVEISAPGGDTSGLESNGVLSTLDSGTTAPSNDHSYAFYQGTSMAAPHVAGVASLVLAVYPTITPAQMNQHLRATVTNFPGGSSCNTSTCGAGIVNAHQAVTQVPSIPDVFVYLPSVMNFASAPPPTNDPLDNPGFEAGATIWTEFSAQGWDIILSSGDLPVSPHGGNWAAWLGGDNNEVAYVQQSVTIPNDKPYLHYWRWIGSDDVCGFDFGGVLINSTVVNVYDLCSGTNTGGWQKHVINLNAYKGQTVTLQIRVETDSSLNSNLFIDDLSFSASASLAEGIEVLAGNENPTVTRQEMENRAP
jgi:subtilisin family serine protease